MEITQKIRYKFADTINSCMKSDGFVDAEDVRNTFGNILFEEFKVWMIGQTVPTGGFWAWNIQKWINESITD